MGVPRDYISMIECEQQMGHFKICLILFSVGNWPEESSVLVCMCLSITLHKHIKISDNWVYCLHACNLCFLLTIFRHMTDFSHLKKIFLFIFCSLG